MKPKDATIPNVPKGFPLVPHSSGQWCRYFPGQGRKYFGPWRDPEAALERFRQQYPYLVVGLEPPDPDKALRVLLNSFRAVKLRAVEAGDLTQTTYDEYVEVCDIIAATIDKHRPVASIGQEELAKLRVALTTSKAGKPVSPTSAKRVLSMARSVFYFGNEEMGFSVRYRKPLRSPSAKQLRLARGEVGERLFTPGEIKALLEIAKPQMRAMILLGINCGLGNRDIAMLEVKDVDLATGWHTKSRSKTGVKRRAPLWPETAHALYAVIQDRKEGLVFRTKYGNAWAAKRGDPISYEFKKLCQACGFYRAGVTTFYSLRRTWYTIGESAGDPKALQFMAGHAPAAGDMASTYRQRQHEAALHKVVDAIHRWLYGS